MNLSGRLWIGLVILAAIAGAVAYWGYTQGPLRPAQDPAVDYPPILDLGAHEIGSIVVSHFAITNRGGGELVIDQVRANCSCSGLEREKGGQYVRVEALRLKAGERADLCMRVSVRGAPMGAQMVNVIEFRTNDPAQPTARITALVSRVLGGVYTSPESFPFGRLQVGQQARQIVEVRDLAVEPRVIDRVTSTDPDQLTVQLLPSDSIGPKATPDPKGTVIGRFEVVVKARSPADVNAGVLIHLRNEDRQPDVFKVVGRICAPIQLSPSFILLPRATSAGPVYEAECIVESENGKSLTLTTEAVPPEIKVSIQPKADVCSAVLRIAWTPTDAAQPRAERLTIRLHARVDASVYDLELPVLLRSPAR